MARVTLRGLGARKLRTALTAVAVVLGVAMIAGTYVLTDTIGRSFDSIFTTATKGIDVSVVPRETVGSTPAFPAALLSRARAVPGVKRAAGGVFEEAAIFGKDGKRASGHGAPTFVTSVRPEPFNPWSYVQGRAPRTAGETALDRHTAEKKHFHLGDTIRVGGSGPVKRYRIVGIAKFGDVNSIAGASVAVLTLTEAQRVTDNVGKLDAIDIQAAPGVTPQELVPRVQAALPRSVVVRTGEQQAAQDSKDVRQGFKFITIILLVFGGVALFVGAFMIFNTFSITVAQRTREFAMLRTLGAHRRQILRAVIGEALLVGFTASVIGLLAGLGLAPGLKALFKALGADLPAEGTVVATRTIVVSLLVGTLITMVASLMPAVRATRVAPVEALYEGATLPAGRSGRLRTPAAALLTAVGVALLLIGLFGGAKGGSAAGLLGVGAAVIFVGVGLLSSHVVRPIAAALGGPLERTRGVTGHLARENTVRNPGRTAATSAALMIGLALITFVAIFAAGIKKSVNDAVDHQFTGTLVVQNSQGFGDIPRGAPPELAKLPGVRTVSPIDFVEAKVAGISGTQQGTAVDPRTFPAIYHFEWIKGSSATLRRLLPSQAVVSKTFADDHNVKVGRRLALRTPERRSLTVTVTGIYRDKGSLLQAITVPYSTSKRFGNGDPGVALVGTAPAAAKQAQREIDHLLTARFPSAEVQTKSEFKDQQAGQVDQLLALFYVMLSLSVIVSLFGIVNTLALSIHERTRELGLVRAIGMSRRQVRRMIRYESVITALIGGILGVALGIFFGVVVTQPLKDQGFALSFPVVSLIVFIVLAGLAGVLAAIGPARRASRLDVLEALAYE